MPRPPPGIVLLGPFLTHRQVAHRLDTADRAFRSSSALLRITSPIGLAEVYPAFQFRSDGVRPDISTLNRLLHHRVDDLRACDWYVEPLESLGYRSPLAWLDAGRDLEDVPAVLPEPIGPTPGTKPATRVTWQSEAIAESPGFSTPWRRHPRASRFAP